MEAMASFPKVERTKVDPDFMAGSARSFILHLAAEQLAAVEALGDPVEVLQAIVAEGVNLNE